MRITQWGEFGVHFSSYIARREREGATAVGATEIAAILGVDAQYAQQILQRLRRGGIVDSIRGPSGGYHLSRPAAEISLFDIFVATEGDSFEIICESRPIHEERCQATHSCGLRNIWVDLKEHVNVFLKKFSLEDLSKMPGYVFANTATAADDELPIQIGAHALTGSALEREPWQK